MKKLFNLTVMATLLAAMALFSGCSDEIVQPETKSTGGELLSRGAYSNPPVEWDHVENIKVVCNSHPSVTEIAVPWKSGSGQNTGIPENWNDKDLMNPDAKKRSYSRENGWIMAFQNLTDPAESNKFFGLYNRFTGVLRFFFYEMDASGNAGTTTTWAALRVSGNTSLLNFSDLYPAAMNDPKLSPMVFSAPECEISTNSLTQKSKGYKSKQWYGIEVEFAYDANATSNNELSARLWAQDVTSISMTGSALATITGSIQTIFSNVPTMEPQKGLTVKLPINVGEKEAQTQLVAKDKQGGNFFKNLWNNIKGQIPQLAEKAAKDGIEALLTNGTSVMVKGLSKLLGLSGRSSSMPMSATSKVDLGMKASMEFTGTASTSYIGWGAVSSFDLPQFASNNQTFSGRLGVWNLQDYPKVTVNLLATSLYYPKELVPNPTRPRASYPTYSYSLSNATLVINPDLLSGYKVENMSQQLVFTSGASAMLGTAETGTAYGLYGDTEYYRPTGNTLTIKGEAEDLFKNWNPSNPEATYSLYWSNFDYPAKYHSIMCHVYFELVSKTNSNERYAYSKYFPVTAVKGSFSHREETITQ